MPFTILRDFRAFQREYRRGRKLTADDVSCWLPDEARDAKLAELIRDSAIEPERAAGSAE